MRVKKIAAHAEPSGRHAVAHAATRRAEMLLRIRRRRAPLPAAVMKYRAALGADGGLGPFTACAVGVAHAIHRRAIAARLVFCVASFCVSSHVSPRLPTITSALNLRAYPVMPATRGKRDGVI